MGRDDVKARRKLGEDNDQSKPERSSRFTNWLHKRQERKARQQTPSGTGETEQAKITSKGEQSSLWDRAYASLKAKDSEVVEKYERLLSKELSSDGTYYMRSLPKVV